MARYNQGYLGDFSGTLGKAVGSKWRGVAYLRTKSSNRRNAKTQKQLVQQAKFQTGRSFARGMSRVFALGFRDQAKKMTAGNYGLSLVMNNAIAGDYPKFTIDYSKVLVSQGTLPNDDAVQVSPDAAGIIKFAWQHNADDQEVSATDQAIVVAYCPEKNRAAFVISATRGSGLATLKASQFQGMEVHTWISFITNTGDKLSNSLYTGKVTVS